MPQLLPIWGCGCAENDDCLPTAKSILDSGLAGVGYQIIRTGEPAKSTIELYKGSKIIAPDKCLKIAAWLLLGRILHHLKIRTLLCDG